MSRVATAIAKSRKVTADQDAIDAAGELEEMNARPADIPADVWELVQENGRLATTRLHQLLSSPKFTRLRAGDQAKLITLAQNRAYGTPKANKATDNKRRGLMGDVVMSELDKLVNRALLPEYKNAIDVDLESDDE